jgi:hypothetical protein
MYAVGWHRRSRRNRLAYSFLNCFKDGSRVSKFDLGFSRVNVHIYLCRVKFNVQYGNGITTHRQKGLVSLHHRLVERAILNPAPVNKKDNLVTCAPMQSRRTGITVNRERGNRGAEEQGR